MIAALCLLLSARAAPDMPGDPAQLPVAADDALLTPALRAAPGLTAGAQLSHARGLIEFQTTDGALGSVLDGATALQLGAAWGAPRADVSLSLPTYLQLSGERLGPSGGAIGDLGAQLRGPLTPRLSVVVGGTVPTGDVDRIAGYGQATATAGLIAGIDAARIRAAYQLTPAVNLGEQTFDDVVRLSAAWTPALDTRWRPSGEVDAQIRRQAPGLSTAELLVGGHRAVAWGSLHVGGGVGLLGGPGTPLWRLVISARRGPQATLLE